MANAERTALAFEWGEGAPSAHEYLAPAVLQLLRQAGARRVLDLGCGNGTFTARIVDAGYDVTGLDASPSGIGIASRLVPAAAFLGSVAPIRSRFLVIASSPSSTCTNTGPEIMNSTRSLKNGRSRCTA